MAAWQDRLTSIREDARRVDAGPFGAALRRARDELLRCLPNSWRARWMQAEPALVLQPSHQAWRLSQWRDGHSQTLSEFDSWDAELAAQLDQRLGTHGQELHLWVGAEHVLRKPMQLPAAAEARLREVVGFEIERQTPFNAEQVSHAARVIERDPAGGALQVELLVLPLNRLQQWLRELGPLASRISRVEAVEHGLPLGADLLPSALRQGRDDGWVRSLLFLSAAGLLCFAALLWMRHQRTEAVEQWKQRVQAAEQQVRETRRLRNAVDAYVAEQGFLAGQAHRHPSVLLLMDDLTRRLSDDTSFDRIAINEGRLTLVGISRKATDVVSQLQGSDRFRNAALAGAVQADPRTGRDRFTVTAAVGNDDTGAKAVDAAGVVP